MFAVCRAGEVYTVQYSVPGKAGAVAVSVARSTLPTGYSYRPAMSNTNPRRNGGELIGKNILCRRSLRPHLNEFRFFGTATKPSLQNFCLNSTCSLEHSFNWK